MPRDYSYSEMLQMQEQAMKRVQDMQKKARLTAENAHGELSQSVKAAAVPEKKFDFVSNPVREPSHISMPVHFKENEPENEENTQLVKTETPFLSKILEDPDKAIILSLLLLLRSEGADELLMMSLLYILV